MAVTDLTDACANRDPLPEIAVFLQRSEEEIRARIAELGLGAPVE
jgi:hypothetical protein